MWSTSHKIKVQLSASPTQLLKIFMKPLQFFKVDGDGDRWNPTHLEDIKLKKWRFSVPYGQVHTWNLEYTLLKVHWHSFVTNCLSNSNTDNVMRKTVWTANLVSFQGGGGGRQWIRTSNILGKEPTRDNKGLI